MNKKIISTSLALLMVASASSTWAKVTTAEASKLGSELTPMGAEKAGNKAGTIPAYTGGLVMDASAALFSNAAIQAEKPLFVITSQNLGKYSANLSDGQKAMFKKYPDTYTMPVYKTHRTAFTTKDIAAKVKKNASTAELIGGGNGIINFDESIPFAIPETGVEVIWNHITRYRGGSIERRSANIPVQESGDFSVVKIKSKFATPFYLKGGFNKEKDDNILFYFMSSITSPARMSGNVVLVHETLDQVKQPRMAWAYSAGQRRVRRAPQIAYDAPSQATDGMRTTDQVDMFNGSPDRYDWKLVGKQEVYIPYNSYKLADRDAKYDDIIQKGHLNQDYTRYELHRVWKVEATLAEGSRHIYGKRTFYVDEDTWQVALVDHFDKRDVLWRVAEGHALPVVTKGTTWYAGMTSYDLQSGRYMAELNNEEKDAFNFDAKFKRKLFTSSALRRAGK
jgi:hypothetical protein